MAPNFDLWAGLCDPIFEAFLSILCARRRTGEVNMCGVTVPVNPSLSMDLLPQERETAQAGHQSRRKGKINKLEF